MFPLYMGELLLRHRFSLIPVRGSKDSSAPKAAAISWTEFQRHHASLGEVATWSQLQGWQIAIMTGRVSGIVVIDFDSVELWQRFSTENPHLLQDKIIVRTKRGFHLYIPVARSGALLASFHKEAWGFSGDGRYVIAPGSEIDGHTYTIIAGDLEQMPAPQPGQLKEILAWLDPQPDGAPALAAVRPAQPLLPTIGPDRKTLISTLKQRFQSQTVASGGRNNALFHTFTWGRDRGLQHSDGHALLADFLSAPGEVESERARTREFECTLRSAFSRPARPVGAAPARLPDSVRQGLARLKLMHVWRILDGLFRAGLRPGQVISRRIALALCGERLGQRNIWQALSDARFFARARKGSLVLSPNAYGVEPEMTSDTTEKCKYSRGQKLQLILSSLTPSTKGRPQHLYTLPTVERICQAVGVQAPRWCSPIEHSSSKEARKALFASKIAFKPGSYAKAALADWFGVCVSTVKNYIRELKLIKQPQYEEFPLSSWNVDSVPEPRMGHWLQADGRRYPSIAALAEKLLKYARVSLVKQRPNYLCTPDYLQQQKQAALARTRAAGAESRVLPTAARKTPEKAADTAYSRVVVDHTMKTQAAPALDFGEDDPFLIPARLFKRSTPESHFLSDLPSAIPMPYPDDAMRALKRGWKQTAGNDFTVKSDRLELVQSVWPIAQKHMRDAHFAYLLDASPRRMLMWLRKRIGDPLYTRADVDRLYKLMAGELTRKKAVAMFTEFGRAKVLRAADFVANRTDIQNPPAYLITCLRADKRMAALMRGGHHGS